MLFQFRMAKKGFRLKRACEEIPAVIFMPIAGVPSGEDAARSEGLRLHRDRDRLVEGLVRVPRLTFAESIGGRSQVEAAVDRDIRETKMALGVRMALENGWQRRARPGKLSSRGEGLKIEVSRSLENLHGAHAHEDASRIEARGNGNLSLDRSRRVEHDATLRIERRIVPPLCRATDPDQAAGDAGVDPEIVIAGVVFDERLGTRGVSLFVGRKWPELQIRPSSPPVNWKKCTSAPRTGCPFESTHNALKCWTAGEEGILRAWRPPRDSQMATERASGRPMAVAAVYEPMPEPADRQRMLRIILRTPQIESRDLPLLEQIPARLLRGPSVETNGMFHGCHSTGGRFLTKDCIDREHAKRSRGASSDIGDMRESPTPTWSA